MQVSAGEKDVVRGSITLPRAIHEALRDATFERRITYQEVYKQALDLWLQREGLPSWKTLTGEQAGEA